MYPLILFLLYPLCIECRNRIKDIDTVFKNVQKWKVPTSRVYMFTELITLLLIVVASFSNTMYGIQTLICLYILTYIYETYTCITSFTAEMYNNIQIIRMLILFILVIILAVYGYYNASILTIVSITLLVFFL